MPTPTLILGRQDLEFPDLGHDPGTLLRDRLRDMFEFLSNNTTGRYFGDSVVPAAGNIVLTHNLAQPAASLDQLIVTLFDNATGEVVDYVNSATITVTAPTVDTVQIANSAGSPVTYDVVIRQREDGNHPFILSQNFSTAVAGSDVVLSRGRNVQDINLNWANPAGTTVDVQNTSSATLVGATLTLGAGEKFLGFSHTFGADAVLESVTTRFNISSPTTMTMYVVQVSNKRIVACGSRTVLNASQNISQTFPIGAVRFISGQQYYFIFTPNRTQATFQLAGLAVGSGGSGLTHNGRENTDPAGFSVNATFSPWFQYSAVTSGRAHSVRAITAPRPGESNFLRIKNSTDGPVLLGNTEVNTPAANKIAGFNGLTDLFYTLMPTATLGLVYNKQSNRWVPIEDGSSISFDGANFYNIGNGVHIPYSAYLPGCSYSGPLSFGGSLLVGGPLTSSGATSSIMAGNTDATIQVDGDLRIDGAVSLTGSRVTARNIFLQGGAVLTDTLATDNASGQKAFLQAESITTSITPTNPFLTGYLIAQGVTFHPWVEVTNHISMPTAAASTTDFLNIYVSVFHSSNNTAPSSSTRRFNCASMNQASLTIRTREDRAIGAYQVNINGNAIQTRILIDCDQASTADGPNVSIRGDYIGNTTLQMIAHQSSTTAGGASSTGTLFISGEVQGTVTMRGGLNSFAGSNGGAVRAADIGYLNGTLTQITGTALGASGEIGGLTIRRGGGNSAVINQTTGTASGAGAQSGTIVSVLIRSNFFGTLNQTVGAANSGFGTTQSVSVLGDIGTMQQTYLTFSSAGGAASSGAINITGRVKTSLIINGGTNNGGGNARNIPNITVGESVGTLTVQAGSASSGTGNGGAIGSVSVGEVRTALSLTGGQSVGGNGGNVGQLFIRGNVLAGTTFQVLGGPVTGGTGTSGSVATVTIRGSIFSSVLNPVIRAGTNSSAGVGGVGTVGEFLLTGDSHAASITTGQANRTVGTGAGGSGGAIRIEGNVYGTTLTTTGGESLGAFTGAQAGTITVRGLVTTGGIFAVGGSGNVGGNGAAVIIGESLGTVAAACNISTQGGVAASGAGGNGGAVTVGNVVNSTISANGSSAVTSGNGGIGASVTVAGFVSQGAINCFGGNGQGTGNGGSGGSITIRGNCNATSLSTAGGNAGTAGNGGIPGSITIEGNNTASLSTTGGNGTGASGTGRNGGSVSVRGNHHGANINTPGGNSTGTGFNQGGAGGTVIIYGEINSSGSVFSRGGNAAGTSGAGAGGNITIVGDARFCGFNSSGGNNTSSGSGGTAGSMQLSNCFGCSFTGQGGSSTSGSGGGGANFVAVSVLSGGAIDIATDGGSGATSGGSCSVSIGSMINTGTGLTSFRFPDGGDASASGFGGAVNISIGVIQGGGQIGGFRAGNGVSGGALNFLVGSMNLRPGINAIISAGNGTTGTAGVCNIRINQMTYSSLAGAAGNLTFESGSTTAGTSAGGSLNVLISALCMGTNNNLTLTAGNGFAARAGAITVKGDDWRLGGVFNINGGTAGIVSSALGADEGVFIENLTCKTMSVTGAGQATSRWLPLQCKFANVEVENLTYNLGAGVGTPAVNANHGKFLWLHKASFGSVSLPNNGVIVTIGALNSVSPAMARIRTMVTKTGALYDPISGADELETINGGVIFVYNTAAGVGLRWIAK